MAWSITGELESQPFLRQMGEALADEHPLPASETLGELEANMNAQLPVSVGRSER